MKSCGRPSLSPLLGAPARKPVASARVTVTVSPPFATESETTSSASSGAISPTASTASIVDRVKARSLPGPSTVREGLEIVTVSPGCASSGPPVWTAAVLAGEDGDAMDETHWPGSVR